MISSPYPTSRVRPHVLRRVLAFVVVSVLAGVGADAQAALRPQVGDMVYPQAIAVDGTTGKTYIGYAGGVDCRLFAVGHAGVARHVAGTGSCTPSGDGGHARAAGIEPVNQIKVDATHVYYAGTRTVRRIQRTNGTISTFAGDARYNCAGGGPQARVGVSATAVGLSIVGMALHPASGHLYLANYCDKSIIELDDDGVIVRRWFGSGSAYWILGEIAFDPSGNLYFQGEPYGYKIYKLNLSTGAVTHYAGTGSSSFSGEGGSATQASLGYVRAITVDSGGNLYIGTDMWPSARVLRVTPSGTLTTMLGSRGSLEWGTPPPGPASGVALQDANSLAVDDADNLYVGDYGDELVGAIHAPVSSTSTWTWLMKDKLRVMEIERNGGKNPAVNNCDQVCKGDPVNTATGEYWETASDLAIPGRGPGIDFERSYGASRAGADGPVGYGWTHSYAMSLSIDVDGYATIRQENGSEIWFAPNGSGGFTASPGQFASLAREVDGTHTLVRRQRDRFRFDANGRLIAKQDLNGYATRLAYDGSGRLETITDEAGRTVTLTYDTSDRIDGLEDAAGRRVAYGYDTAGDLVSVVDVRGEPGPTRTETTCCSPGRIPTGTTTSATPTTPTERSRRSWTGTTERRDSPTSPGSRRRPAPRGASRSTSTPAAS